MKHEDFNRKEHGFVGHLAEPDEGSDRAVSLQKVWAGKSFSIRNLWGIAEKIITNWN